MDKTALKKLQETLELAAEFVKDENTLTPIQYITGNICMTSSPPTLKKKSNDIREKAEIEAFKLERQEKCAKMIREGLDYLRTVNNFENNQ